jgi:hypothetical protein
MCTRRICGDELDVEALLGHLTLEPAAVYRRGAVLFKSTSRRRATSGGNIGVSDEGFANLDEQIADVCAFIEEHRLELAALRSLPGVEHIDFDFPVEEKDVTMPSYRFPAKLIELLASIGAELEVSLFPAAKDGSPTPQ